MKSQLALLLTLALLTSARAQQARLFRIAGPVATTITAIRADGYVTWTNIPTNATFTVQTAVSLGGLINWVDYIQVPTTTAATTNRLIDPNPPAGMVIIPAGSFTMGNTFSGEGYGDELPLHTVYVSAFYMDRYEVTKALWDEVYNWAITHGYSFDYANSGEGKASNHPAQRMTWYDAVKWCNARSEKEGRVPAYYTSSGQTTVYRSGQVDVDNSWVNWNSGYRLPTESEREKAARGGSSGHRFPWSNVDTISHSQANYNADISYPYNLSYPAGYHPTFASGGFPYTSPAGYFAPNGYGLYDMDGNVLEWCWDWYGFYGSVSQTDPRGPASGPYRRIRGGSWRYSAIECRTAGRGYSYPYGRSDYCGFRSVRPAGQ